MKKLLLLFVILFLMNTATFAQLRFGITGSLQSSKLRASSTGFSLTTSSLFGGYLGGVAEYTINDNVFIRPEALISFKGGSFRGSGYSYKTSLSYLEIPVVGVYKYEINNGKIIAGIGPYVSFLMSGTADDETLEVGEDITLLDAGLRIMGGYELTEKQIAINLFYDAGLASIVPASQASLRNNTFGLSLTYFFGSK